MKVFVLKNFLTGDVMYDEFLYCASESYGNYLNNLPKEFVLLTWHRQENTSDKKKDGTNYQFFGAG